MNWNRVLKVVGVVAVAWLGWWTFDTFAASERTQMLRMQEKFIRALEGRKWSTVDSMIYSEYADEFGQDAALVKRNLREVFGNFFFLSIENKTVKHDCAKGLAWVSQTIKIKGTGAGVSTMVISESTRIKEPWIFHWHKHGSFPWSWELVQVHNRQANYNQ